MADNSNQSSSDCDLTSDAQIRADLKEQQDAKMEADDRESMVELALVAMEEELNAIQKTFVRDTLALFGAATASIVWWGSGNDDKKNNK